MAKCLDEVTDSRKGARRSAAWYLPRPRAGLSIHAANNTWHGRNAAISCNIKAQSCVNNLRCFLFANSTCAFSAIHSHCCLLWIVAHFSPNQKIIWWSKPDHLVCVSWTSNMRGWSRVAGCTLHTQWACIAVPEQLWNPASSGIQLPDPMVSWSAVPAARSAKSRLSNHGYWRYFGSICW